jgi:hypothetical protein
MGGGWTDVAPLGAGGAAGANSPGGGVLRSRAEVPSRAADSAVWGGWIAWPGGELAAACSSAALGGGARTQMPAWHSQGRPSTGGSPQSLTCRQTCALRTTAEETGARNGSAIDGPAAAGALFLAAHDTASRPVASTRRARGGDMGPIVAGSGPIGTSGASLTARAGRGLLEGVAV